MFHARGIFDPEASLHDDAIGASEVDGADDLVVDDFCHLNAMVLLSRLQFEQNFLVLYAKRYVVNRMGPLAGDPAAL